MSEQAYTQSDIASIDPTGANTATFIADRPMKIVRWGYISSTTALTGDLTLTASVEQVDGTAADPTGAAQGGTLTVLAASHGLINQGAYINAENFATGAPLTMVPGERFDVTSDSNPTVGSGHVFIEYVPLPFVDHTRPTADPGATDTVTTLGNMTELTS